MLVMLSMLIILCTLIILLMLSIITILLPFMLLHRAFVYSSFSLFFTQYFTQYFTSCFTDRLTLSHACPCTLTSTSKSTQCLKSSVRPACAQHGVINTPPTISWTGRPDQGSRIFLPQRSTVMPRMWGLLTIGPAIICWLDSMITIRCDNFIVGNYTQPHTWTYKRPHWHIGRNTLSDTHFLTDRRKHAQSHRHTDMLSLRHTHTHIHTHTYTHTHTHFDTLTHWHTDILSLADTRTEHRLGTSSNRILPFLSRTRSL